MNKTRLFFLFFIFIFLKTVNSQWAQFPNSTYDPASFGPQFQPAQERKWVNTLYIYGTGNSNRLYIGGNFFSMSTVGETKFACRVKPNGDIEPVAGSGTQQLPWVGNSTVDPTNEIYGMIAVTCFAHYKKSFNSTTKVLYVAGTGGRISRYVGVSSAAPTGWEQISGPEIGNGLWGDYSGNWGGDILDMEVFDNNLYISGTFKSVNGTASNCIVRYDGLTFHPLGNGNTEYYSNTEVQTSQGIYALQKFNDGTGEKLFCGGVFKNIDNTLTPKVELIAIWDGSNWENGGTNAPTSIGGYNKLIVKDFLGATGIGAGLYVAGQFTKLDNSTTGPVLNNIAKWDGSGWEQLMDYNISGIEPEGRIDKLAIQNGNIYATGYFNEAGLIKKTGMITADKNICGIAVFVPINNPCATNTLYQEGYWRGLSSTMYSGVYTFEGFPGSINPPLIQQFGGNCIIGWKINTNKYVVACGNFHRAGDVDANNIAYWNGCP